MDGEVFNFNVGDLEKIIDKVSRAGVKKFRLAKGDFELSFEFLEGGRIGNGNEINLKSFETKNSNNLNGEEIEPEGEIIISPIVGTFYGSPAPEKPAFFEIGDRIKKGDTLFIIESMKLMNEVKSEVDGVLKKVFVESGQSVEYGQPIMEIV